ALEVVADEQLIRFEINAAGFEAEPELIQPHEQKERREKMRSCRLLVREESQLDTKDEKRRCEDELERKGAQGGGSRARAGHPGRSPTPHLPYVVPSRLRRVPVAGQDILRR